MKTATYILLISLVGLVLIGCGTHHAIGRSPLSPPAEEHPAVATVPTMAGKVGDHGRPAALFVEFVATPQDVVERMLEMAGVTKVDVVYDLGCGDGRIVIRAAQRYGCRAVGYDLDPLRVQEARQNVAQHKVGHLVTIEQKDILHAELQDASVVTLYLGTEINVRLIPQLEKLRPGARIVSHDFPLGDLTPDKIVEMTSRADNFKHTIYLWTCPLPPQNQ